jgi:WD40 repeat protein
MPIQVACPCGFRSLAPDPFAGKKVKCPKCNRPLEVPDPSQAMELTPVADDDDGAYGLAPADPALAGRGKGDADRLQMHGEIGCHYLTPYDAVVSCVTFAPDCSFGLAAVANTVYVMNLRGGKQYFRLEGHRSEVCCVGLGPDGRLALSGAVDGGLLLWDVGSRRGLCWLEGHRGAVNSVCFASHGAFALSAGEDGTARLWEVASAREVYRFRDEEPLTCAAFSPDASMILVGTVNGNLALWDVRSGQLLQDLKKPPGRRIGALAFRGDGRRILAAGVGGGVAWGAWDKGSPSNPDRYRKVAEGYKKRLHAAAFCPDGFRFLAGGDPIVETDRERTMELHSTPAMLIGVESGTTMRDFKGHMRHKGSWQYAGMPLATIYCAAVSSDGTRGMTGGDDGRVEVWSFG